jgi:hypothetical protein
MCKSVRAYDTHFVTMGDTIQTYRTADGNDYMRQQQQFTYKLTVHMQQ